jgi:3-phenylpropionate/trans-cinnamate dioxygenase ferredoxin subunit
MTIRHVVCALSDLPPGERKIVTVGRRSIGVFNVKGNLYALRNRCPHKGAPLCRGIIRPLVTSPEPYQFEVERDGEILRCPWHGWEFDLATGRSIFNPHAVRVRSYDVSVEPEATPAPSAPDAVEMVESVENYPVTVEQEMVVLHVPA